MLVADLSSYEPILDGSSHLLTAGLSRLRLDGSAGAGPGPPPLDDPQGDVGRGRRGANMTECVTVPSSEHVAEIVGRQGT